MDRGKLHSGVAALVVACLLLVVATPAAAGTAPGPFLRGDVNGSGIVDIADAVAALSWLFSGGATPACVDAADTNDDGTVNVADPVGTLAYLFGGGSTQIPLPFPGVGFDPTPDALPCTPVDCLPSVDFEVEIALGSQTVTVPTAPVTWSPSVLGIGIMDVTFNLNNTINANFGAMSYDPATGTISMANSSFPVGASLDIDGPLFLDFSCSATVTVGMSGDFTLAQEQISPELILVIGLSDTDIDLSLQNISLASCGLTAVIFDAVYPLISSYVNGVVSGAMQGAVFLLAEGLLQTQFLGLINDTLGGIAICAP